MKLSTDQINLILYCLEQQQIEFNDAELSDMEVIVAEMQNERSIVNEESK